MRLMFRKDVILRMGAVEQEYRAAALSVSDLVRRARDNPTLLHMENVTPADIRACRENLENTFHRAELAKFARADPTGQLRGLGVRRVYWEIAANSPRTESLSSAGKSAGTANVTGRFATHCRARTRSVCIPAHRMLTGCLSPFQTWPNVDV